MGRVNDPPDLVKALAAMRRQLRRIPSDLPQREEKLRWLAELTRLHVNMALQPGTLRERLGLAEPTTTPEDTLRDAGIDDARQATYQRKFSTLLARKARA